MLYGRQRPFYMGAESIGSWMAVFEILSIASVLTNCAIIAFTSSTLQRAFSFDRHERFVFVVALEHAILFLKYAAAKLVPDTPRWVLKATAYQKHLLAAADASAKATVCCC